MCGLPLEAVRPWQRVSMASPVPPSEAVRKNRLIWVASQDEMVRAYPRAAAGLPYRFALAALPLNGRSRCWGSLILLWPAEHSGNATPRERSHLGAAARRIARALDEYAVPGAVPDQPQLIPAAGPGPQDTARAGQAAADYVERLPEGALALDLESRITYVNPAAEALLGRKADQVLGTRPWQSLPWLDTPEVEDHYRTAVLSRDPVAFTVERSRDTWLCIELFPDASGISARLTRAPAPGGRRSPSARTPRPAAAGPGNGAQAGRLYQLAHLAAALTETVAVRDVIDLVADQILPAFGADGLILSTADAGRLQITGHHGYDPGTVERLDGLPLDTDLTPAGEVLATGVPAFYSRPEEMARAYPQGLRISGKQAWAFLPLIISNRPVGCCILSYDHPRVFSADERAVLTSLAGLIAQALDRARLYDATHDIAHGLQQALLPRGLPTLPGLRAAARYLPAGHGMDIGGDFYDLIRLDATTAAAVIGDVQGHNVAAAALMGQVRTAIHATAGAPPDQVLARTNRVLGDLGTDLLVSCLYVHIDLARQRARLATAGHPPPLLHRPGRAAGVVELDPAPMLGAGAGRSFPVTGLDLGAGTTLALYTDGLVEAPGRDIDPVTADLADCLAGYRGRNLDGLIDTLLRCSWPTGRYTDDIAMLLLRTDPVPPG
ncbi:SpoIIE family protein phosphatase [Streptomyces sp. NPDC089799]|uniref:SpoIIE family protein phosphatase n=1 Tax=Streptomyces sp. NPDC089799 TaxID=3155066 RepID=UPI0034207C2F